MFKLQRRQEVNLSGLPLFPVRLVPETHVALNYSDIVDWGKAHNIYISTSGYYIYFKSEEDATFFMLGYTP